jgi:hypothetical protein
MQDKSWPRRQAMLKLSKIFIILLVIILFITGCSTGETTPKVDNEKEPVLYKPMGKNIVSPVKISYVIDNPLEIIEIRESLNNDHERSYFKISGLKDKKVEEEINQKIKAFYEGLLPYVNGEKLPPYRGIQAVIKPDRKINNSRLAVHPQFNCNNVLSVGAFIWVTYNPSIGNNNNYFSMTEAINIDLNTGKEFMIQDVFTNNVDGLSIVNDAVMNYIQRNTLNEGFPFGDYNNFHLVAPFKGISYNQKFYLNVFGLNVILDYGNPEFELGFHNNIVIVPFYSPEGNIAITERFFDKNSSLFEGKSLRKRFIYDHHAKSTFKRENFKKGNADWIVTLSYPENAPLKLLEIIDKVRGEHEEYVELLGRESVVNFVELNFFANYLGNYYNLNSNMYIQFEDKGIWKPTRHAFTSEGIPLKLEDLFIDGYNYEALIKQSMERTIREYGYHNTPTNLDRFFHELMFSIEEEGIYFTTKPHEWTKDNIYPLQFFISFSDFGFENLKIFE